MMATNLKVVFIYNRLIKKLIIAKSFQVVLGWELLLLLLVFHMIDVIEVDGIVLVLGLVGLLWMRLCV